MRERPILFSGSMVRAILAGRKTQTRRVVKRQWPERHPMITGPRIDCVDGVAGMYALGGAIMPEFGMVTCPYGKPGDELWVRESWRPVVDEKQWDCIEYRADGERIKPSVPDSNTGFRFSADCDADAAAGKTRWRPSIHMPRWASRLILSITDIRIESLQGISFDDAAAEGIDLNEFGWKVQDGLRPRGAVEAYRNLWESINGPESWAKNPWVWVVEFERIQL